MSYDSTPPCADRSRILLTTGLLLLGSLLVSCQTAVRSSKTTPAAGQGDKLSGNNTLSQVAIRTTGSSVSMAGTTVDGRRVKSQGRTTRQAVDNLGTAANASR